MFPASYSGMAGALLSAMSLAAAAGNDSPDCTQSTLWHAAASVEAPCTAELAKPGLSPRQRAEAFYLRGRGYQFTRRLNQAAADYDAALNLDPAYDDALLGRANVDLRQGDFDRAVERIQRAIEINPRNARAYRALGVAYQNSGAMSEAIKSFTTALGLDPLEAYALLFRVDAYLATNRYADALADANALVGLDPAVINRLGFLDNLGRTEDFHVVALARRAQLYETFGQHEKAAADFDAAVRFNPLSSDAFLLRSRYRIGLRQYDAALKDAEQAVVVDRSSEVAEAERGRILNLLGRFDEALEALTKAIVLNPGYANAYILRALAHRALDDTDAAVRDFESAISLDSGTGGEIDMIVNAGYWPPDSRPIGMSADLEDAIRACMLDKACT